jgi:hypothetical protein
LIKGELDGSSTLGFSVGYRMLSQILNPQSNPHLSDFTAPTAWGLQVR